MNKKKKQNGFTIVELVIVIAVIGILAAVLIPTFSNLVKKAKESADRQLVYYINEAVVANEVENGKEATMYDTLQVLDKEYGFTIERMTPRSGCDIVWDSVTNRFALVKDGTTIEYSDANKPSYMANKAKMWKITTPTDSLEDGYSHYLTADWTGTVEVTTGVDVGENDDITSVTYARTGDAQTAVIRTNSVKTEVEINAANDTVKHYGTAGSVNVKAVASNSYHEYGKVPFIQAANGRIALEKDSEVAQIHLSKTGEAFNNITIAKDTSVEMPVFSRDDVEIASEGTLVVALQDNTSADAAKDYVWLTRQGIYEQITVSNNASSAGTIYADQISSVEKQEAAQQIANNIADSFTIGDKTYTVEVIDREVVVKDGDNVVSDTTIISDVVNGAVVETGITAEAFEEYKNETVNEASIVMGIDEYEYWIDIHSDSFAGGSGTVTDPYQISNGRELALLAYYMNSNLIRNEYKDKYYVLTSNIDLSGKCWTPISNMNRKEDKSKLFQGHFDGKSYTISGLTTNGLRLYEDVELSVNDTTPWNTDGEYSYGLFGTVYNAILENVNFTKVSIKVGTGELSNDGKRYVGDSVGALVGAVRGVSTITNVHINSGSIQGYDATGGIVGRIEKRNGDVSSGKPGLTMTSCSNAANVTSVRRVGGLVGYRTYCAYADFTFSDCSNSGNIVCLGANSDFIKDLQYYMAGVLTAAANADSYTVNGTRYEMMNVTEVEGFTNTGTLKLIRSDGTEITTLYIYGTYKEQ